MDGHIHLQAGLPASREGRIDEIESTPESSSRSTGTPGSNASRESGAEGLAGEEGFGLKQRVNTFPKDADGNILPVHDVR